jgi:hypothetical protein
MTAEFPRAQPADAAGTPLRIRAPRRAQPRGAALSRAAEAAAGTAGYEPTRVGGVSASPTSSTSSVIS